MMCEDVLTVNDYETNSSMVYVARHLTASMGCREVS